MWIYVLAPLAVDPGPDDHVQLPGLDRRRRLGRRAAQLASPSSSPRIFNIIGFLFVVFGIKIFALTQKIVMFFGIGGCIVIGLVLTITSRANFVAKWNAAAAASRLGPTTTTSSPRSAWQAGQVMPTHLELGRHLRLHGRHVVAVRLRLLDRVHRRRGQAPRQDHHLVQPLRHRRAVRVHDLDRASCSTRRSASSS